MQVRNQLPHIIVVSEACAFVSNALDAVRLSLVVKRRWMRKGKDAERRATWAALWSTRRRLRTGVYRIGLNVLGTSS